MVILPVKHNNFYLQQLQYEIEICTSTSTVLYCMNFVSVSEHACIWIYQYECNVLVNKPQKFHMTTKKSIPKMIK